MADFNILMVGGRRCGKSTVLYSMQKCMNAILCGKPGERQSAMFWDKEKEIARLNKAGEAIEDIFKQPFDAIIPIDDNLSPTESVYTFKLKVKGQGNNYTFKFTDVPGEWYTREDKRERVLQLLDENDFYVIAIDTPFLMEEIDKKTGFGKYHKSANRVEEITAKLEQVQTVKCRRFLSDVKKPKILIFSPVKCEKYVLDNAGNIDSQKMNILCESVMLGYSELIQHFKHQNYYYDVTMTILPIITIGNVAFANFMSDENGRIIVNEVKYVDSSGSYVLPEYYNSLPDDTKKLFHEVKNTAISLFCFPSKRRHDQGYNPALCEQPLIYILVYALSWMEKRHADGGVLEFFRGLLNFYNDKVIKEEVAWLKREKMLRAGIQPGVKMLQNPFNI